MACKSRIIFPNFVQLVLVVVHKFIIIIFIISLKDLVIKYFNKWIIFVTLFIYNVCRSHDFSILSFPLSETYNIRMFL